MTGTFPGGFTTGILKDGRICDFYETEEYYQFLLQLREWYEKGYIFPDAAFTDETQAELYQAGLILSKPFTSMPGMADELMADDPVCLKTTDIWKGERGERAGFWVIPVTSKNQAAAMKFLNLMLTDTRIGNLFSWGIEGKHYVVKEDGTVIISGREGYCNGGLQKSDGSVWRLFQNLPYAVERRKRRV